MNDSWDDYADDWDQNPDARTYSEKAFEQLRAAVEIKGARVLDFGCGTGLLTEKIAPLATAITALDASQKMVAVLEAKRLPNVTAICGTLEDYQATFRGEGRPPFDLVVASSVCAFVDDYTATLRHILSLLKPGGRFVQWDWLSPEGSSHPGFTEAQISSAMKESGFSQFTVGTGFQMDGPEGGAAVLMAVAVK